MTYVELADLAAGGAAPEAWFDAVKTNLEHFGGLVGLEALKDIATGGSVGLIAADYDSGVFSSAASTTTTKAHSLSALPRLIMVEITASATPADADYRVVVASDNDTRATGLEVTFNDTNVKIRTPASNASQTNELGSLTTAYYRILAWK